MSNTYDHSLLGFHPDYNIVIRLLEFKNKKSIFVRYIIVLITSL